MMSQSSTGNRARFNAKTLVKQTEISLLMVITVLFLIASFGTANFISAYNLTNILKQSAVIGVIAMVAIQLIFTYAPIMNTIFQTEGLIVSDWVAVLAVGLISYAVIEIEKGWRRGRSSRARVA